MISENYYDGLIAEWYDDWLKERKDDVNYYRDYFRGFKGSVFELACGTGRVLIPIAQEGVSIDGLDSSADMLKRLEKKLNLNQLNAVKYYKLSMSGFDLPHEYDAFIITSGSFQLLTTKKETLECLKSVKNHLAAGGFILMDVFVPWDNIRAMQSDSFTVTRDCKRDDGRRCVVMERFKVDIVDQVVNSVFRYEVYNNGLLEQSIIGDFPLRWYWKDELKNLLFEAGFKTAEFLIDSPLYKEGKSFVLSASVD